MADLQDDLATLGAARLYFNHQSVGSGILDGVAGLGGLSITLASEDSPDSFAGQGIVHTMLGANTDPAGKLEGFRRGLAAMEAAGAPPDLALMKFCFIDFDERTEVAALFAHYRRTFEEVTSRYPRTLFVHTTVPLVIRKPAWKLLVKGVLGRREDSYLNGKRDRFSDLVRGAYPADRVLDIARLEATAPTGEPESFPHRGARIPALVAAYSDDGAHLGPLGRKVLARAFVERIARVLRPSG